MKKDSPSRTGRCIFAGIIIFLLAFCALSLAATGILFSNYFGRNELSLNEIALNYGDVDSNIYPRSNIQFLSGDNTLQGYIYGETNGSGLIVIAHGIMSGADSYLAETMYFVDNGWIVFAFDGTGTRGSEGKGINGLPQTKLDLLAALSYIEQDEKLAELPVVLYGHSMGGYAVTSCLKDYTENIKTVICVSGFNSPLETMHYNVKSVVGFYANIEYPFIWIYQHFLFGKDANITAIDGINSVDIPILIVYGTEDDVVPYDEIGIYAYKECITNPNVSFLSIDEEGRNWHDNMHLSQKSGLYTQDIKDELSLLQQQFGNPLSDEMFFSFIESVDKAEMNSLHDAYMRNLWDFFNTAIS